MFGIKRLIFLLYVSSVALAILFSLYVRSSFAANAYIVLETPLLFQDTAGQAVLDLRNLVGGSGRFSDRIDRGAGARTPFFLWRCSFSVAGTQPVDQPIEVYLVTSDGTHADGELPTTTGALTSAKRSNLVPLGSLIVDQAAASTFMTVSGQFQSAAQYLQIAVWNATSATLAGTSNVNFCKLTPYTFQAN